MASAMLVSRNETSNFLSPNHHQPPRPSTTTTTNFMGKLPYLNPNPNPNSNSNFNNNNNYSRKQLNHQNHQNGGQFHGNHTPQEGVTSLNHQNYHRKLSSNDAGGSGNNGVSLSHYVNYDISTLSKAEIRSLKTRLMSELDKVRSLSTRIESGDFRNGLIPKKRPLPFQPPHSKESKRGKNQNHHHNQQQQQQQSYVASAQVMKMCAQVLSKVMKQKAGYVFNEPVDVVGMGLHDYHQIIKRPMDLGTIKKNLGDRVYNNPDEFAADVRLTFNNALMYNPKGHEVHTLAEKFLAKFEQYFRPVSQKFLLEKHQSLRQNQLQNHHHQQSHPIPPTPIPPPPPPQQQQQQHQKQHKLVDIRQKEDAAVVVVDEVQGSSWSKNPSPEPPPPPPPKVVEVPQKKPEPRPEPRVERVEPAMPQRVERIEPRVVEQTPPPRQEPVAELVQTPVQEAVRSGTGRGSSGKLPKPKAKDPNKREMNMEEKHKLGAGLQSLPEEKMSQVIQIIRKRNGHLTQDGDEIELDIEAVDTETLWELDRFVTNYKKMVSKLRRQALMDMQNNNVGPNDDANQVGLSERMVESSKASKRGGGCGGGGGGGDVGEEDVDIGDEMPVHNFPPVEIDKDDDRHQAGGGGGNGGGESSDSSSSSSSGSESSSSSDSDSGSSSGSDSDVDDAQSRDNESKNIPR